MTTLPEVVEKFVWTEELEALFFQAFIHGAQYCYKPTGINKHFHMLIAYHRFIKSINRNVDIECLWDKLEALYDLDALDTSDPTQLTVFPNEEKEFKLPDSFQLLQHHQKDTQQKKSKKKRRF